MIFIEIGRTIVTATVLFCGADGAAIAFAEIDTTGFVADGKFGGAVKTAVAPLADCNGVIVPHGVAAQLTFHWTPEFVGSFCTTAETLAVAFVNIVAGGAWVMLTTTGGDTWKFAIALKLWSAVANAVMVMMLPTRFGMLRGTGKLKVPPDDE